MDKTIKAIREIIESQDINKYIALTQGGMLGLPLETEIQLNRILVHQLLKTVRDQNKINENLIKQINDAAFENIMLADQSEHS